MSKQFRSGLGRCLFCGGEDEQVVGPAQFSTMSDLGDVPDEVKTVIDSSRLGVCDVCSYALRHAWQEAQGERIVAISPRLVRTYVLVPRLKKNRSSSDLSGYDFMVGVDGRFGSQTLPFFDHVKQGELPARLSKTYGVVTWQETTRKCYLGYDGHADFSEVVLAWSWGKETRSPYKNTFSDFEHLLASPSADSGFYLGVKAAFEALLWRAEVQDEGNALCVYLRESAVRYLAAKDLTIAGNPRDEEEVDDSMVEVYRCAMSPEETRVVELITQESSTQESSTQESSTQESEVRGSEIKVADPRVADPRVADPRVADPRVAAETMESEAQTEGHRPEGHRPENHEPEVVEDAAEETLASSPATNRVADPRVADPRVADPRVADPRSPESIAPGYARPKALIKAP